jgi:hypothetical protein
MDLPRQQWTIILRQESFNVRFGVSSEVTGRRGHVRFDKEV